METYYFNLQIWLNGEEDQRFPTLYEDFDDFCDFAEKQMKKYVGDFVKPDRKALGKRLEPCKYLSYYKSENGYEFVILVMKVERPTYRAFSKYKTETPSPSLRLFTPSKNALDFIIKNF